MEDNLDFSQPKKYQMFEFSRQKYRFLTKIELAKHVIFNLFLAKIRNFLIFMFKKVNSLLSKLFINLNFGQKMEV